MKIVCINGSPRPQGNSAAMIERFTATAKEKGAEIETFHLGKLTFSGCVSCRACKTASVECVINDDLQKVLDAAAKCDVMVLASPVYFGDVTGQTKCFIDRTYAWFTPDYISDIENSSRLEKGKHLVFFMPQGYPDPTVFDDIIPKYARFLGWFGFDKLHVLRAPGAFDIDSVKNDEDMLSKIDKIAGDVCA